MDICKIDKKKPWLEYRNDTKTDEDMLRAKRDVDEGIVCYYKETKKDTYIAVMAMDTSFWQVLLWFFLPLLGIILCWVIICSCLCWYCCPPPKYITKVTRKSDGRNYQEVEVADDREELNPDYDPDATKEALCFDDAGEHMKAGKWPMSGPAAACDM